MVDDFLPIPREALQGLVNKGVHIEGHKNAIYRLVNYSQTQATVYNQHTKETLYGIPIDRLRYTRKNEPKQEL